MSLRLSWNNEQTAYEITPELVAKLEELLKLAGKAEDVPHGEVALTFVDDAAIQELNKQYRGLDKPTDVLSFSMQELGEDEIEIIYGDEEYDVEEFEFADAAEGAELDGAEESDIREDGDEDDDEGYEEPLGDVIISVQRAVAQAEEYGHSVDRELGFLFVHGFLHLIGYDHQEEEEEKAMFGKQERILQQAGLTR
ncbi:probable rRNA maturation factor [Paenibacillus sp. UNCCL117]|uniref:rRNA maturation RNase YbeY n=1 Tax=unclassified Paenibacillus TaxID=185978 RepID=UPI000890C65A|nr:MULTISPECIES: rRNA maturation RNase YbeY [unclassified Paenibacillus]SDC72472.1 probable rRNA maturation factor [Paenibacillus sp. cl123]SFW24777.1 probable rRNA maturation factor [Paenibacillus sp. UNCCL117]